MNKLVKTTGKLAIRIGVRAAGAVITAVGVRDLIYGIAMMTGNAHLSVLDHEIF